jgi:hypothetical protein
MSVSMNMYYWTDVSLGASGCIVVMAESCMQARDIVLKQIVSVVDENGHTLFDTDIATTIKEILDNEPMIANKDVLMINSSEWLTVYGGDDE